MFDIDKYSTTFEVEWNDFIEKSKNGTFLFNREYMDYHTDRFLDYSLMIYRAGKLFAVLPANRKDNILYSHQGLTYGGFIMSSKITTLEMLGIFKLLNNYLKNNNITSVIYKAIPSIYHQIPAQEDLYALFINNAKIIERNISSTIYQNNKIGFNELRRRGIRKAKNNKIVLSESENYADFWRILENNLMEKYGKSPVHSFNEMTLLHSQFPNNIKLFMGYRGSEALGGVLIYITKQTIHTQYIAASPTGKLLGVLDLLFDYLINSQYTDVPIFDFGQSTEQKGKFLNEGLIFQKEGFGGRGIVYDIYEYNI